jgi:hypothetical protein
MTNEYFDLCHKVKEAQGALQAYLNGEYPKGTRVLVTLRYGQVHGTLATVWGCSWEYGGVVAVEIDSAKPHSRQRFRRVSPQNVTRI